MPIPSITFSEERIRDLGFIQLQVGDTYPDQYFVRAEDIVFRIPLEKTLRNNFLTKYPGYRLPSFRLREE